MIYDFNKIIGHIDVIEYFKRTIKSKNISHSYLLEGGHGIGKRLLAKTFAKTLFCEKEGVTEPCHKCTSCLMMETGNNPDYFEVISTKASIGVDDIREQVVEKMEIKPYRSRYKIFIIPEADRMTIQAQNALLKTIEEPPNYGIVILLAENPGKIISTVHSRCARIRVLPLSIYSLEQYIESQYDLNEQQTSLYANFSNGSIGQAKHMIEDGDFWGLRQESIEYMMKLEKANLIDLYDMAEQLNKDRENLPQVLDFWMIWYRDMLMIKTFKTEEHIFYKDFKNQLLDRSKELSYNKINNNFYEVIRAKKRLSKNINAMLIIENLLLELKERNR